MYKITNNREKEKFYCLVLLILQNPLMFFILFSERLMLSGHAIACPLLR